MNNLDRHVAKIEAAIQTREPMQMGEETQFLCPSHDDHNPSARWNAKKQVWYCDACGTGGGYVDLAKRLEVKRS